MAPFKSGGLDREIMLEIKEQPAAETRKADGASLAKLLILSPPKLVGIEVCVQGESDRLMLQMDSHSDIYP